MDYRRQSLDQMQRLGETLGEALTPGCVILLAGSMGAGKTTLTRAIARGLGVDRPGRVCSPTFNICLRHPGRIPLVHVDLFRLAPQGEGDGPAPASFEALGLEDLLDELSEGGHEVDAEVAVLVIEWADVWNADVDSLRLELGHNGPEHRDLNAQATGPRHQVLLETWRGTLNPSARV